MILLFLRAATGCLTLKKSVDSSSKVDSSSLFENSELLLGVRSRLSYCVESSRHEDWLGSEKQKEVFSLRWLFFLVRKNCSFDCSLMGDLYRAVLEKKNLGFIGLSLYSTALFIDGNFSNMQRI